MLLQRYLSTILIILVSLSAKSQVIELYNPSWEGPPHQGAQNSRIIGWNDCGAPGETPPDIHAQWTDYFSVRQKPYDGSSFLGMVVRATDTWEYISQRLKSPLQSGQCHAFSVFMARSTSYRSGLRNLTIPQPFTQPIVLRIYGSNLICATDDIHRELLAESSAVRNTQWERYDFKLKPSKTYRYIILEAYYKSPTLFPYNGNVLLDNASAIITIDCDEDSQIALDKYQQEQQIDLDELLAQIETLDKKKSEPTKAKTKAPKKPQTITEQKPKAKDPKKSKSLIRNKVFKIEDLNKPLSQDQIIRLKNFYFEADHSDIKKESTKVLDELYIFLRDNPEVKIEIGGHTNSLPKHEYCDRLSLARAKAVRSYLVNKGIAPNRLLFKGYGKRRPVTSDTSLEAQRKNQRVEIKILSLG